MFYSRIIVVILFYSCILAYFPLEPNLSNNLTQSRELVPGWPSLGIIELAEGPEESIVAATGGGPGLIDNINMLNSIENNIYYISDSNLPIGSNPAMRSYNGGDLIVVSGVTGTVQEPEGTGISWSLDGGNTWNYIPQPVDDDQGSAYITKYWNNIEFDQLSITTNVKNVSYDIDVDLEYNYIYATSWAGMLQRFKYTDSNPSWELVPLPMDGQDNLSCDFSCDDSGNQSCCDYTINQNPNQNCDNNPNDYYANPVDGSGFDNHKAFSVYIDQDNNYIWVGTAYGVNKGEIVSENCINWTHYTKENTNTSLAANWIIGFHKQSLSLGLSRLWAITWEPNSSTPHKLSYSDDNGNTWKNDNGLEQGIGAVTYNLDAEDNILYASTSKGLFEINPFNYGCMDIAADNYDPLATIDGNCEYTNNIIDGCDLSLDYFYLINSGDNEYQILYNSSLDIQSFNFDIIGADLESIELEGDASEFLYFNWEEDNESNPNFLGGNFDASTFVALPAGCGHLLTLVLSNEPLGLSNISINGTNCYNYYTLGPECIEDAQWSKVEIPSWIFDNLFIENEQNSSFKVYSSYVSDFNSLWIGTTRGLIVADMSIIPYEFYHPSLSDAEKLTIYPNPYLSDTESPVIFEFDSPLDGVLEIYDFSMSKVFSQNCSSNGELLSCAWYGLSDNGYKVSNGVYFCKLKIGNQIYWEKLGVVNIK
tara:strand:- start:7558 stop:9675 length:2118 start_codon:yes stop_codon:yes gene_type:complete